MGKQTSSEKELEYLQIYLEELKAIPPVSEAEKETLFHIHKCGEKDVKNRLAEIYLMDAVQIAAEYRNRGVSLADLVQEANIGLLTALSEYEILDDISIKKHIRNAVVNLVEKERAASDINTQIVEKVNQLNETSKEFAERYGKEPDIVELAEYLHMTEEEVKSYMKMSLDAVDTSINPK